MSKKIYLNKAKLQSNSVSNVFTQELDQTTSSTLFDSPRYNSNNLTIVKPIDINRHPSLDEFESFLISEDKQEMLNHLNAYKNFNVLNKSTHGYLNIELLDYSEHVVNCSKFNLEYYLIFRRYVDFAIKDKQLHHDNKDIYINHFDSLDSKVKHNAIVSAEDDEKRIDFSLYKEANWRMVDDNIAINKIHDMCGFIGFSIEGKIILKLSATAEQKELAIKTAENVIYVKTKLRVKFITQNQKQGKNEDYIEIPIENLMVLEGEDFRPDILEEYYHIDGAYYRNRWKPTALLKVKPGEYKRPEAIFRLIYNLVNYDEKMFHYFINWLAFFFQGLNKSIVAIVFISKQGVGKGVFVDEVLKPLFNYCFTVNSESLGTKYKGGIVKDRLFLVVNESDTARNGSNKSFTKQWITDKSISAEVKGKTLEQEIKIFAQTMFFSNERVPVDIEKDDRRFTVKESGPSIKDNLLGYGTYDTLIDVIKSEIIDFAIYLKSLKVDYDLANKALDTPEKTAIIYACSDSLQDFADNIENRRFEHFQVLLTTDIILLTNLGTDFKNHRIEGASIHKIYSALFRGERNKLSPKALMAKLRLLKPHIFLIEDKDNDERWIPSNGKKYYKLP